MKKSLLVLCLFLLFFSLISFPIKSETLACNSCSDCSQKIQSASAGDTVLLTANILNYSGSDDSTHAGETCISFGGADNITFDCNGHTISGNGDSYGYGIWLNDSDSGSNNNTIRNCANISYFYYGIYVHYSDNNTLTNITSSHNSNDGLYLDSSRSNTLTNITLFYNHYGILLFSAYNNTLNDIISYNNQMGILFWQAKNNTLINSYLYNNSYAAVIFFVFSDFNKVINTTFSYNTYALDIVTSANNVLRNITIKTNSTLYQVGLMFQGSPNIYNDIDTSVTVDGKPVLYYDGYYNPCPNNKNLSYGNTYSQITFIGCRNVTLHDTTLIDSLNIFYTNESTLYNINSSYSYYGLYFNYANNNTVINITTFHNHDGLYIYYSKSNIFTKTLDSYNSNYGIYIYGNSDFNIINSSRIENNTEAGIYLDKSGSSDPEYNTIYNNILNNTLNIKIGPDIANPNYFNATLDCSAINIIGNPCVGGNYWTDPDGGNFSDTCEDTNGDGICDSEYIIDASYSWARDFLPIARNRELKLWFAYPTPENLWSTQEQDWIYINASSDKRLNSCVLEWNDTNITMNVHSSGFYCYINLTGVSNGTYTYRVYGNDVFGNENSTETRSASFNFASGDLHGPVIKFDIKPQTLILGTNVSLYINASDPSGVDSVWIIINSSQGEERLETENDAELNYTPEEEGTYYVSFYANDTLGNEANASATFVVINISDTANITIKATGWNGSDINVSVRIISETIQYENSLSGDGIIEISIVPKDIYTLIFSTLSDKITVALRGVDISNNMGQNVSFDVFDNNEEGFGEIYAIETDFAFTNSSLTLKYRESDFENESSIFVNKCPDWNFSERRCEVDWERINFTLNQSANSVTLETDSFSAFTIEQASYCGDGICSSWETSESCASDCACTSGETRPCNISHYGICAEGTETCVAGHWQGCPSPETETCNGIDDDCDGIIDNIGGYSSVADTQCGCYNGSQPKNETCNGIDDDCDGTIDEDGDCCENGQTRTCGPSNEIGICKFGTSTCTNNIWGECTGAVYPAQNEICFNNEDDNCNGQIDEGCDHCTNNVKDYDEEGIDCGGSCTPCVDYLPIILIVIGALILVVLVILVLHMKSQGKELTWEELMKRWSPANES